MPGKLRFKCRMCNKEFDGVQVPDLSLALVALVNGFDCPWPGSKGMWPGLVTIHDHKDRDTVGVADLIGGVEV